MTPERVKLYAAAARRCVPITIGNLEALDEAIGRAITQAINEVLDEAASAYLIGDAIRALKLPVE